MLNTIKRYWKKKIITKRPWVGSSCSDEEEVFLFNSEPRIMILSIIHYFFSNISEISSCWCDSVHQESFAKDQDSILSSKWIFAHENWPEPDFRLGCNSLTGWRTIIGPPFKFFKLSDFLVVYFSFGSQISSCIEPNVFSDCVVFGYFWIPSVVVEIS